MTLYPIIKALHIISFTSWMAGMFYLPRLYAYHAGVPKNSTENIIFKVMERRLLRAIINPAMIATFVFGIWLAVLTGYGSPENGGKWLMVKVCFVLLLTFLHGLFARWRKKFDKNENTHSPKFYKVVNEMVTIIFVIIVFLVVLKPF